MAEVYTISGSGFGDPTPEQYAQMEHANAQVIQKQQVSSRVSPAVILQNALKALGTMNGDSKLSKLKVDGVIGTNTVNATNYAFATYLSAPNVMSLTYIRQHVVYLGTQVTSYVEAHGMAVPPPWIGSKKPSTYIAPPPGFSPGAAMTAASGDNKWVWYVVGGVSVLLVLAIVAKSVRRAPAPQTAKA